MVKWHVGEEEDRPDQTNDRGEERGSVTEFLCTGSTASNTELSEFLSAYYICVQTRTHRVSLSQNSPSLPQNSVSSLLRNSTLETVFRPFPICWSDWHLLGQGPV